MLNPSPSRSSSAEPIGDTDDGSGGALRGRRCDILIQSSMVSALVSILVGAALAWSMRDVAAEAVLLRWLGALSLLMLARGAFARAWKRTSLAHRSAHSTLWLNALRGMVFLSGLAWGVTPWAFGVADLVHEVIMAFAIAGISAGGMTALAIDGPCLIAFLFPAVAPLIMHFLRVGGPLGETMGVMGVLYLAFVAMNAVRVGRGLRDNLRLEREAEARERSLRESEDRLKRAQQVAKLGSFDWNPVTGEVRWSDEHFRLWGLEPGSAQPSIGLFSRGVHPEDRAAVRSIVVESARSGQGYDCAHRVQRPDGSVIYVQERAEVIHDDRGKVARIIGTVQDITSHRAAEERIRHLAYYDPLTGLPNRHLLLDRLQSTLDSGFGASTHGALFFIDLDNFKNLNDTYGHDQGDLLLQLVAQRIQACARKGDVVARLGGDEFVVLLERLDPEPEQAAAVAGRIGSSILAALQLPYALPSREYHSTSSLGVAMFCPGRVTVDELLKRADLAMYQAKAAGRNTLCYFTPEMQAKATAHAALEADLRIAVESGGFDLYLQGQVDADGCWIGAEALLRWPHPVRGMVSPAELIPIAEESGLILPIGSWVLGRACALLVEWQSIPAMQGLTLAVNVSARQFRQEDFVQDVLAALATSGANPRRLKLELTESLLLADVEEAIRKMAELRAHGVGFALDDFGIGYSSLSYLKRLPLAQLKIDKTFVQDVLVDPNDAAIATMILALGHSLGLEVIAEGVETEGQREFLARIGCKAYQGYLFSSPVPPAAFQHLLCGADHAQPRTAVA